MTGGQTSTSNLKEKVFVKRVGALIAEAWALRDEEPVCARALAENACAAAGNHPADRAKALITLGFLALRESRYDQALSYTFEALTLLEPLPLEVWVPRLFNNFAICYQRLGERSQALEFHQKQLEWAQKLGVQEELFSAYHDLGVYCGRELNLLRARTHFEEARNYIGSDTRNKALLLSNLGEIYALEGDLERGQELVEQALELARSHGLIRVIRFALETMATIWVRRADYARALAVYRELLAVSEALKEPPGEHFLAMAKIYLTMDHPDQAYRELEKALRMLEQAGEKRMVLECHELFCNFYKGQQDFGQAFYHLEQFHAYYAALFNEETEMRVRALDAVHRMDSLRRESELLQHENAGLEAHLRELRELHDKVRELSVRDPLTGLYNRRHLFEQAQLLFKVANRYKRPLCVAMIDVDHFKKVNDTCGHAIGDAVLGAVADVLKHTLRTTDLIARYGGEEFVVVMPDTPLESAALICERFCQTVSEYPWKNLHPNLQVTVSVGLASASFDATDELFSLADERLYIAKREGRNRVYAAQVQD